MALFKCKMCGGTLEINNNQSVATCEYCGTGQTLPKLDDEKRANMYDRANHFRRNNEYDKAMGIYEHILNEDNTDAEAYWSLVLCSYGIEYVEDPISHKRIPTINRAQYTSVFNDANYKMALQYADIYQKTIYEEEAKTINEIQKGILEISQKEEPFDVFICYKETDSNGRRTQDSVLANDLYHQLTQENFKVFFARITLEDKLGSAYEPYIFAALNSAKVMVVLGTKPEYFNAVWVKNEWSRYLALIKQGQQKMLVPAYRDMDPYDLPEEFSYLQAQDMSNLGFMQDLIRGIKKIIRIEEPKATVVKETSSTGANSSVEPLIKRVYLFLEDGEWSSANDYCERVLDIDPENVQAYIAKLMIDLKVRTRENIKDCKRLFKKNNNYQKILRFADDGVKEEFTEYLEIIEKSGDYIEEDFVVNGDNEIEKDDNFNNLAQLARTAISEAKFDSAYKYSTELLEKESDNPEMIAIQGLAVLGKEEIIKDVPIYCVNAMTRMLGIIPDYNDTFSRKHTILQSVKKAIDEVVGFKFSGYQKSISDLTSQKINNPFEWQWDDSSVHDAAIESRIAHVRDKIRAVDEFKRKYKNEIDICIRDLIKKEDEIKIKKRNKYWESHSEEKEKLDTKINEINELLNPLSLALEQKRSDFNEIEQKMRNVIVPSYQKREKLKNEVRELENRRAKLKGLKRKEMKQITEEIHKIQQQYPTDSDIEREKEEYRESLKKEINVIKAEISNLEKQVADLETKRIELTTEINKVF